MTKIECIRHKPNSLNRYLIKKGPHRKDWRKFDNGQKWSFMFDLIYVKYDI